MRPIFIFLFVFMWVGLSAQDDGLQSLFSKKPLRSTEIKKVTVDSLWSADTFLPGELVYLGLKVKVPQGFHIYPPAELVSSEGDLTIYPSKVSFKDSPDSVVFGSAIFPEPKKKFYAILDQTVPYYEDAFDVLVPVQIGRDYGLDQLEVQLVFEYQMCDDQVCQLPAKISVSKILSKRAVGVELVASKDNAFLNLAKVVQSPVENISKLLKFELFGFKLEIDPEGKGSTIIILCMTILGGFLLNFTPCVLPVIPLKIMSLTNTAKSRKKAMTLGFVMFFGVISFWALIGFLIAFSTNFTAVSQMFQYPSFTILIGLVILVMSVGMMGYFEIRLPKKFNSFNPDFNSVGGSFGIGVMTAILSTPCTAPFMGTASAWSLTKPPLVTLVLFVLIGIGMGLPYFVLSVFPQLVKWMPRGGDGTLVLKKILGFFMLAASFYFLGIGFITLMGIKSEPMASSYWWLVSAAIAFAGLYLVYQAFRLSKGNLSKGGFSFLGLVFVVIAVKLILIFVPLGGTNQGLQFNWVPYTKAALLEAKKEGRPILLDFTAEWCLNCKALEKSVLQTAEARKLYDDKNVILMKVDITDGDAESNELLKAEGSITIPYLVLYGKDGSVLFKGDFYTLQLLKEAFK